MTTAGVDPNLAYNIQLLQKQSLKVEFHLDHTDYKRVENIGTGAYGVVCSAINKKTRQRVAIKKIPNLFTMDPRYAIRTYREIKILQHFKHGNIIAIREILQPANKDITDIYVVMDLMESDLHRIIYSKQALTDEHVQYFLYQILRGLKYIHSAHVIHRDLKPSNLLVNADCELKIGDFGMARGINIKAEKSNQQMTQYVATRWYRAPELIVAGRQGYGAAIDMWSVGCIFAEMLRRKHLFPGRDLLNQLTVIFGTLGIPSKTYLQLLDSDTVCGFIRKITDSDEFKPKTYSELCPKASPVAIDLLSQMLVIEPEKRIDVERALSHPFLAKYHDNAYEPNCSKTFDFAFEQELVNLHNDDQKRTKIQALLRKEVLSYRKPQPIDFNALITPKCTDASQTSGETGENPYADLNAFLAQLASPVKESNDGANTGNPLLVTKPSQPATNPLLDAQEKPVQTSSHASSSQSSSINPLLQGVQANPNNSLLNAQSNAAAVRTNSLLSQQTVLPFQKGGSNPLLFGASQPNSLLAAAKPPAHLESDRRSEKGDNDARTLPYTEVIVTTSESDHSNDTELFNSFILNHSKKEEEEVEVLTVNTVAKPNNDDIEMISAKLQQTDISEEKPADADEKPEAEPETKALDAKSLLRQRIIANMGNPKGVPDKPPGKMPITAHKRQKEREERKKLKQLKAKQNRKKKKEPEAGRQLLTKEDQELIEKWKRMAQPQPIQPKPSTTTTTIAGNNVIVVYPAAVSTTYISSTLPAVPAVVSTSIVNTQIPGSQPNANPLSVSHNARGQRPVNHMPSVGVHSMPGVGPFMSNGTNPAQRAAQPIRTFSDIAAMHGHSDHFPDHGQEASLYDINQCEADPAVYTTTSTSQGPVVQRNDVTSNRSDQFTHWSNAMTVNTMLDINGLVESKADDGLPPMLVSTPKGTGGGYGVGFDMESMIAYNPDMQNIHMDSAPLSASLLADWMDVTSTMDPKTLEDIQRELELNDFPFSY